MDQHAVPQNISSYEFRLVGDMTLKQFFQLAGGAGVALVFYKTPFPFFIKWPLMGISALTGILMAFVPVAGRPFSQWLLAFVQAIYSPTKFVWQPSTVTSAQVVSDTSPKKLSPLDILEEQLFSRFSQMFNQPVHQDFSPPPPTPGPIAQTNYVKMQTVLPPTPPSPPTSNLANEANKSNLTNIAPKIASLAPMLDNRVPIATKLSTQIADKIPPPTQKNILVGQIIAKDGKPIEGAILEIVDNLTSLPVRALRTNRLGQFQIATPLFAGEYTLLTEKVGLTFEPLLIKVPDIIVPPILITPD